MPKSLSKYLRLIFLLGDVFILNFAVIAAFVAFGTSEDLFSKSQLSLMAVCTVLWLMLYLLFNPYKFSRISRFAKVVRFHLSFIIVHFLAVVSVVFIIQPSIVSPIQLATLFCVSIVLLLLWRGFFFYLNKVVINKKLNYRNVVIVGFGELAFEMRKFFRLHPEHGFRFLGYFDQQPAQPEVYPLDTLAAFCKENNVHEIYCCLPYVESQNVKSMVNYGLTNLIKVKLITDYRGFFNRGLTLEHYDSIPVLKVAAIPLDENKNLIIKRCFDIVLSGAVIALVLSWMIPIIALLIKLDSKGPVFFRQKRAGKGNRPFTCLKFRTMVVHGQEFKQATKNDPRVTPIGQFLRKTSLDEFPQFINVLIGDMSIIGPRPHPLKLNEQFHSKIEKFMARHYIKPGITGLAQAKGFRGETITDLSMKSRVKLDRFYIENWSFALDIKIIFATITSLAKGDQKAY